MTNEKAEIKDISYPYGKQHCHPKPQPPAQRPASGKQGHRLPGRTSAQSDVRPGKENVKLHIAA